MPAYLITTPPIAEPVGLDEMKLWLKQDQTADDPLIAGLISSARDLCETYTNRVFVTQTWSMVMDAFPGYLDPRSGSAGAVRTLNTGAWYLYGQRWGFQLPVAPVQSIVSLTYQDQNGNPQTLASGVNYNADLISSPGRIFPVFSTFWPLTQFAANAVTLQFICGYGTPTYAATVSGNPPTPPTWVGTPVPESIRTAIKLLVSWLYDNRDAYVVTSGVIRDNPAVAALLSQYRDY